MFQRGNFQSQHIICDPVKISTYTIVIKLGAEYCTLIIQYYDIVTKLSVYFPFLPLYILALLFPEKKSLHIGLFCHLSLPNYTIRNLKIYSTLRKKKLPCLCFCQLFYVIYHEIVTKFAELSSQFFFTYIVVHY